jgi:hypothetical protein
MSTSQPQSTTDSTPTAQQITPGLLADEPRQRLEQAFRLGQLLAQLRFLTQQAWMSRTVHPHCETIDRLFNEVLVSAGSIVESAHRREVQQFIEGVRGDWESNLGSEWHADELFLLDQLNHVDQLTESIEYEVRSTIEISVRNATNLLDTLQRTLFSLLSGALQRVLDLGMVTAEAQHRPDVFRFVLEQNGPIGPPAPVVFGGNACESRSSTPWFLWKLFEPGELPAPDNWLRDVRARWSECGLPESELADLSVGVNRGTSVNELVQTIEQAFDAAVGEAARQRVRNEPLSPGYLGLILDEGNGELSREGRPEQARLTPLKFRIMRVLLHNGDSLTSRERLEQIWHDDERYPEAGTIDNELSELRGILETLGVTIANRRRRGWILQEQNAAR